MAHVVDLQACRDGTDVQLVHPDWEDSDVDKEVAAILAEEGMAVPDPIGDGEQIDD